MRVAVLMGGMSAEREVSLDTGRAIASALRELGHEALEVDVDRQVAVTLAGLAPDAAFMALHGRGGEDGTVQGLLEIMRIPYTGCGVLASALTMDKVMTKEVLASNGLPVAEEVVLQRGWSQSDIDDAASAIAFPMMVKPACEGSSIGVVCAEDEDGLKQSLQDAFARDDRVMLERFIEGRQFTVGVIGEEPQVLPVLEIITREGFYDFKAKYQPGFSEYEVPAKLDEETTAEAQRIALESFRVTLCEGVARIDLMLEDRTGELYVLEINTIPGMTPTSLLPKGAAAAGLGFGQLVEKMLAGARLKIDLEC
jgi:D-alanine-D-alanine ligase